MGAKLLKQSHYKNSIFLYPQRKKRQILNSKNLWHLTQITVIKINTVCQIYIFPPLVTIILLRLTFHTINMETGFLCGGSIHTGVLPSLVLHPKVQCPLNCINWNGSISWSQRQLHWKAGYGESLKIYFRKIQREFSGFLLAHSQLAVTMTTTMQWQHLALPLPFFPSSRLLS